MGDWVLLCPVHQKLAFSPPSGASGLTEVGAVEEAPKHPNASPGKWISPICCPPGTQTPYLFMESSSVSLAGRQSPDPLWRPKGCKQAPSPVPGSWWAHRPSWPEGVFVQDFIFYINMHEIDLTFLVYSSMNFNTGIDSCDHHHHQENWGPLQIVHNVPGSRRAAVHGWPVARGSSVPCLSWAAPGCDSGCLLFTSLSFFWPVFRACLPSLLINLRSYDVSSQ